MTCSRWFCWVVGVSSLLGGLLCVVSATGPKTSMSANFQGSSTGVATEEKALNFHVAGIKKALAGDYASAIADYNRALMLSPQNPEIYYNRAVAHYSVGHTDLALQDFDRTLQIQPTMAEAYANRSTVRLAIGDTAGALVDGKKAVELFEQQGELGLALEMQNWLQQASPHHLSHPVLIKSQ